MVSAIIVWVDVDSMYMNEHGWEWFYEQNWLVVQIYNFSTPALAKTSQNCPYFLI